MQNAVDSDSSTLRTIILYLLILISTLFLYDLFFHVKNTNTNSNFVCVSSFRKPFTKPNVSHNPNGYQIAKDRAFN